MIAKNLYSYLINF